VRQASRPYIASTGVARALEALLGATIDVWLREVHRGGRFAPIGGAIALELGRFDGTPLGVLLEFEAPLAVALTARALKRPSPKLAHVDGDDAVQALAGGLAAIVLAACRWEDPSAGGEIGGPLRILAAGPSERVSAERRAKDGELDTATFGVAIDREVYLARAVLGAEAQGRTFANIAHPFDTARLAALGAMPLAIPIVIATYRMTAADLAALEVGDAFMLGAADWTRSLQGEVVLAAPDADWGARGALVEGGALVLRAGREEILADPMPEEASKDPLVEAIGDVPIVVRVEVGRARMTAREWAELGVGDIVGLAHKLAEPVTLRVAGVEVAKGELVEIEGEIGVRILSRQGPERAT
jgi:flagellar motor switch/type III secretory pathway protein FliN